MVSVDLKNGGVYRAPDGRIFKINAEYPRYASGPVWTFIPPDLKNGNSWRDSLENLLFFEHGIIGYFDFSGHVPVFVDTGWQLADFTLISN